MNPANSESTTTVSVQQLQQKLRDGELAPVEQVLLARLDEQALDAGLIQAFLTRALELQAHERADRVLQRLQARFPDHSQSWRLIYQYWRLRTDWPRALEAIDRVAALEGWSDNLRIGRASVLEKMLCAEEALAELEQVGAEAAELPRAWLVRASVWQQLDESQRLIRELGAWLDETAERNTMVARCWKMLGRELDRQGDYDDAWRAFAAGNAMEREIHQPDLSHNGLRLRVACNRAAFTQDWVAGWTASPPAEYTPAFLVGFPRSGTTLLEQVLDAHPGIQAMEEKPCLEQAWSWLYQVMFARAQARGSLSPRLSLEQRHETITRELAGLGEREIEQARQLYFQAIWTLIRGGCSWTSCP